MQLLFKAMTIESPPLWLQGGTYPARLDRLALAEMREEGVANALACKVSQRSTGANLTVDIGVGGFWIRGDDQALQGTYQGRITAVEPDVPITPPPTGSNQRYDLVTLRVNDPNAGGNAGNNIVAIVVAGVPSATPAVPVLPPSSLLLAVVGPITASTPSITNAIIHDAWTASGPTLARSARLLAGERGNSGDLKLRATNPDRVTGWLYCNGQAVDRIVYAALFAEIGVTFGSGNQSTTFNLPDFRDRVPVAVGGNFANGALGGAITNTLTINEMPNHGHTGITSGPTADHSHGFSFTTSTTNTDHAHGATLTGYTNYLGEHSHIAPGDPNSFPAFLTNGTGGSGVPAGVAIGQHFKMETNTNVQGAHSHQVTVSGGTANSNANQSHAHSGSGGTGGMSNNHEHLIPSDGGNAAHNNMQPYQVAGGWMIRT